MRALLALLVVHLVGAAEVAVDQAPSWYRLDASHHGKHAAGGVVIGVATYAGTALVTDARGDRYSAAVVAGAAIGIGYELAAGRDGGSVVDPVDAAYVAAGALVGAALADLTGQLISITPRHDGAALAIAWEF